MPGPESDEPDSRREPTDVDKAFAAIVAGWDAEAAPRGQRSPEAPDPADEPTDPVAAKDDSTPDSAPRDSEPAPTEPDARWVHGPPDPAPLTGADPFADLDDEPDDPVPARRSRPEPDPDDDTDHFTPPEPPPLPTPRPRTLGGIAMLLLGAVLVFAPDLLRLSTSVGLPLGLLMLASGIGWLVLGLRSGPPPDSGWDDGAQL